MKLNEFLGIIDKYAMAYIDDGHLNNGRKVIRYLDIFINDDSYGDKNPIYDKSEDFLRKVFNGRERLTVDCANFYLARIDPFNAEDFFNDIEDCAVENMAREFRYFHEKVGLHSFSKDLCRILRMILTNIVNIPASTSIRDAEFKGNTVVVKGRTINLPPELVPTEDISKKEMPYINALLRVYEQKEKSPITLEDLKTMHPRYEKHLKIQRELYFSAESVLHQIRDIFSDGIIEFEKAKNETLSGIQATLLKEYKNALERVDSTMEHVVVISYGKSFLTRDNNGLIGNAEKQGMVHMLVNDGKVEWIVDYDTDI